MALKLHYSRRAEVDAAADQKHTPLLERVHVQYQSRSVGWSKEWSAGHGNYAWGGSSFFHWTDESVGEKTFQPNSDLNFCINYKKGKWGSPDPGRRYNLKGHGEENKLSEVYVSFLPRKQKHSSPQPFPK